MLNKFFKLFDFTQKYKWLALIGLVIFVFICSWGIKNIKFNNDMGLMLPKDKNVLRSLKFLKEANFSDKVVVSFTLNDSAHSIDDLITQVDIFKSKLGLPLITEVVSGFSVSDAMGEMVSFLKYIPQTVSAEDLIKLDEQLNDEGVNKKLSFLYKQLITPSSTFMVPFIRQDPMGVNNNYLNSLQKIAGSLGYEVNLENKHFVSKDRKSVMLILKTSVLLTDGFGAKKLISELKRNLQFVPDYVSYDIVCGHLHTISNEEVIKKDIQRTTLIASIAFLLIFLVGFKDLRASIFFLIPLVSVVISMNITAWFYKEISYFVAGMGAVIVGIADDYGIHVYFAVRSTGRRDIIKEVIKPLFIAVLITCSVFFAFFFSSVEGYHQLAFFSITSICLCFLIAIFIFPSFISLKPLDKKGKIDKPNGKYIVSDKTRLVLWLVFVVVGVFFSFKLKFNNDVMQFDGSKKEVFQAEERFHNVWGGKNQPAFLVVEDKSKQRAFLFNDNIYSELVKIIDKESISSLSNLWPSYETRKNNVVGWNEFWQNNRRNNLYKLVNKYGAKYAFSSDAFNQFFENTQVNVNALDKDFPENFKFLNQIKERFYFERNGMYQVMTYLPDTKEIITKVDSLIQGKDNVFVVSRKNLSNVISKAVSKEILNLGIIAFGLILFFTFVLLKNFKFALISLIPVVTAMITIFCGFVILNKSFNTPAIIACMVVVGLCIDYGIFMLHGFVHRLDTDTPKAVWVSALTTIIGAAVLLFAQHPVLYSIGLTLFLGLFSGYIAVQNIVPSFYNLWIKKNVE